MPILSFTLGEATKVLPISLVVFFMDLMLTTFVQIAFGTTRGFFRYRNDGAILNGKKKSLSDIIKEVGS